MQDISIVMFACQLIQFFAQQMAALIALVFISSNGCSGGAATQ
jgi:hypothetical protein